MYPTDFWPSAGAGPTSADSRRPLYPWVPSMFVSASVPGSRVLIHISPWCTTLESSSVRSFPVEPMTSLPAFCVAHSALSGLSFLPSPRRRLILLPSAFTSGFTRYAASASLASWLGKISSTSPVRSSIVSSFPSNTSRAEYSAPRPLLSPWSILKVDSGPTSRVYDAAPLSPLYTRFPVRSFEIHLRTPLSSIIDASSWSAMMAMGKDAPSAGGVALAFISAHAPLSRAIFSAMIECPCSNLESSRYPPAAAAIDATIPLTKLPTITAGFSSAGAAAFSAGFSSPGALAPCRTSAGTGASGCAACAGFSTGGA
mmetsp:Transcript_60867/g.144921  ORF Transcript_60867/g.144921 Transcript_60867/m.144921 type:complete len:314 (+) Transcript_60867:391-1332(+)